MLLAGQKSGVVYALDPDKKGEILWQVRVGKGGINGGVQWGMASDGQKVYAATSDLARGAASKDPLDPRPAPLDSKQGGGLTALRIGTGEKVWHAPPVPCGSRPNCSPAQAAAVTAIPGVIFSGSLDGHLRAYSAEEGKILWDFDTVREYETVNGVHASGGALNGPGAVVVGGMLFVNSAMQERRSGRKRFAGIWARVVADGRFLLSGDDTGCLLTQHMLGVLRFRRRRTRSGRYWDGASG